ncbi:MAG TPA: hypothetical protein VHB25_07705 [Gemmatimonadaceae bacterium]|nr:hypothetical protein [Gemmatimonadaceae bacterium]
MRELVSTQRVDFGLSVRVALDAAGIQYWSNDPTGEQPMRICVLDDSEYERARSVLRTIPIPDMLPSVSAGQRFFKLGLSLFILIAAAAIVLGFVRELRG